MKRVSKLNKTQIHLLLASTLLFIIAVHTILAQATSPPIEESDPSVITTITKSICFWLFQSTDNLATLIGYGLVCATLIVTFLQWKRDQKWKRMEVSLERIKAFTETPGAQNAIMILASEDRDVPLLDKEKPEDRYKRVTWKEASKALIPNTIVKHEFNSEQMAIRDSFNDLLGRLSHLNFFLEEKLLSKTEAKLILGGIIKQLERKKFQETSLYRNLCLYIDENEITGAQNLFEYFEIPVKKDIEGKKEILRKEVEDGYWNNIAEL